MEKLLNVVYMIRNESYAVFSFDGNLVKQNLSVSVFVEYKPVSIIYEF